MENDDRVLKKFLIVLAFIVVTAGAFLANGGSLKHASEAAIIFVNICFVVSMIKKNKNNVFYIIQIKEYDDRVYFYKEEKEYKPKLTQDIQEAKRFISKIYALNKATELYDLMKKDISILTVKELDEEIDDYEE